MTSPRSFKQIVLLLSLLFLVFQANAQVVRFSEASEQQLQPRKRVVGTLKAFNQANVASVESGKVVEVLVNEGDTVTQGDILANLDTRRLDAEKQRLRRYYLDCVFG